MSADVRPRHWRHRSRASSKRDAPLLRPAGVDTCLKGCAAPACAKSRLPVSCRTQHPLNRSLAPTTVPTENAFKTPPRDPDAPMTPLERRGMAAILLGGSARHARHRHREHGAARDRRRPARDARRVRLDHQRLSARDGRDAAAVRRAGRHCRAAANLLGGLIVFTVASAVCALSWSLPTLVAARLLQGLGASAIMSVNTALISAIFPTIGSGAASGSTRSSWAWRSRSGRRSRRSCCRSERGRGSSR